MSMSGRENEIKMYWRLMKVYGAAGSPSDVDPDTLDELEVLSDMTDNDRLRALCIEAIAASKPLALVVSCD